MTNYILIIYSIKKNQVHCECWISLLQCHRPALTMSRPSPIWLTWTCRGHRMASRSKTIPWVANHEEADGSAPSVWAYVGLNTANKNGVLITTTLQLVMASTFPGRNNSLSVVALMLRIESEPIAVYQANRELIVDLFNIDIYKISNWFPWEQFRRHPSSKNWRLLNGLNVFWNSDVTSKKDRYTVVYIRNDTDIAKISHSFT